MLTLLLTRFRGRPRYALIFRTLSGHRHTVGRLKSKNLLRGHRSSLKNHLEYQVVAIESPNMRLRSRFKRTIGDLGIDKISKWWSDGRFKNGYSLKWPFVKVMRSSCSLALWIPEEVVPKARYKAWPFSWVIAWDHHRQSVARRWISTWVTSAFRTWLIWRTRWCRWFEARCSTSLSSHSRCCRNALLRMKPRRSSRLTSSQWTTTRPRHGRIYHRESMYHEADLQCRL